MSFLYFIYIIFNSNEVERGSIPAYEYSNENVYKILYIFMTEHNIKELMNITKKSFQYIIEKFLRFGMLDPFLENTSKINKNPFSILSQIDNSVNKNNIKNLILNELFRQDFQRKINCKNQNDFISGIVHSINTDNPLVVDIKNLSFNDKIFYYYKNFILNLLECNADNNYNHVFQITNDLQLCNIEITTNNYGRPTGRTESQDIYKTLIT